MPLAVVLGNQNIKLLSARNGTVGKWETVSLPSGLIKDGYILNPPALAKILDGLFTSLKLPRREVVVSITGLSFTYRLLLLPVMKKGLQREAIERAMRREIKVPLEELYLDWQVFSVRAQQMNIFVLGVPRPPIDALLKTMEQAGVALAGVDIKPLALARAAGQSLAVIVGFEPDWFDIAIIAGGVPVTLHSFAPRNKNASLEDNIQLLKEELERTVDFFNLTNPESPLSPRDPVILVGSPTADPASARLIQEGLGRPLGSLVPRLRTPGNFSLNLYADNLGLLLKQVKCGPAPKGVAGSCLDIHVDPLNGRKRVLARPLSRAGIMAFSGVMVLALLVIAASLLFNQEAAKTLRLQVESDRLDHTLLESRLALDESASMEIAINTLTSDTTALRRERGLISGKGNLSAIFGFVADSLPPGARYTAISSTAREITIEGRAVLRADIIGYADNLASAGQFAEVRIALIDQAVDQPAQNGDCFFRIIIRR